MPFTSKDWRDSPGDLTTPITAAALEDLETRLAAYADSLVADDDVATFTRAGTLVVAAGSMRFIFPFAVTLISVTTTVGTAPTGAAVLVDVNKNGTTIFTTQGNRPSIAISGNASSAATPAVTAIAGGDYLTVDVDQIGSTVAGADLLVQIRYRA